MYVTTIGSAQTPPMYVKKCLNTTLTVVPNSDFDGVLLRPLRENRRFGVEQITVRH